MGSAASAVVARYDELASLLAMATVPSAETWRPAAAGDTADAAAAVHAEARQLDARSFDRWLAGWTDDAVLWVPLPGAEHPATDQSLFLDDRRRLADRVRWHGDDATWSEQPPSSTVRVVGTVEAWRPAAGDDDRLLVRSALLLARSRAGVDDVLAGHQVHELVGPHRLRRTKVLLLPALAAGIGHPSDLL